MQSFVPILEYGLTGLAAILAFLAYRLLLKESGMESPRSKMLAAIKSFMILAMVLAILSGASSVVETFYSGATQKEVTDLNEQLLTAKAEIERLRESETSQERIAALQQELVATRQELESLKSSSENQTELAELRGKFAAAKGQLRECERRAGVESDIAIRQIANRLLSDFPRRRISNKMRAIDDPDSPASPLVDASEAPYRTLKRAVFNHLADFECDAPVLEQALAQLVRRGRAEVEPWAERIVNELPEIMRMRLRWLEDEAVPALRADIELLESTPFQQRGPHASVPIPRDLWLFDHPPGDEPAEDVDDMAELEAEVQLLKEKL